MSSAHGEGLSMKSLYVIIGATIGFGFLTGVIVFLLSSTGQAGDGGLRSPSSGFIVTARMYGACETSVDRPCLSYKIEESGAYVFRGLLIDGVEKPVVGKLASGERSLLRDTIRETDLQEMSTMPRGVCTLETRGVAFRYEIEQGGESFLFDSCKQTLTDSTLFTALETYFQTLYEKHADS